MFSYPLQDFMRKLRSQIDICMDQNPLVKPAVVNFTCSFSELKQQWIECKFKCYDADYVDQDLNLLFFEIEDCLKCAKAFAIEAKAFVGLCGREQVEVDESAMCDGPVSLFCKNNLTEICAKAQKLYDRLCDDLWTDRAAPILQDIEIIKTLARRCLYALEEIQKGQYREELLGASVASCAMGCDRPV